MKVAILCEFSGIVRDAFIAAGHDAISCDLEPTESQGPHIQGDLRDYEWSGYDLIIGHPECTYLTVTANRAMKDNPGRMIDRVNAIIFFMDIWHKYKKKMLCIENPVGVMSTAFRKPNQYIQPYWFGDPAQKKTGLWLSNLPPLFATKIVNPDIITRNGYSCPSWMNTTGGEKKKYIDHPWHYGKSKKIRSRTFPGVAAAMASQWGDL